RRSRSSSRPGRVSRSATRVSTGGERHGRAASISASPSAASHGRHDGGDLSEGRRDGTADLRRTARHGHLDPASPRAGLPPGVGRGGGGGGDRGHGNVYLRIPVYAAATEQAALEEPFDSITFYFSRQADLQQAAVGRTGAGPAERLQARVERLAGLSYEQIRA